MNRFPILRGIGDTATAKAADARRQYQEKFGAQAPPFDPARRRKLWMDPDAAKLDPAAVVEYTVLGNNGPETLKLTAAEAATVNLPGAYDWPEWSPAPTAATFVDGNGGVIAVGPDQLSTREQALAIMREIGGVSIAESDTLVNWNGETRRWYEVVMPDGRRFTAGLLLSLRNGGKRVDRGYVRGVGAPGAWDLTGPEPRWIPARETDNGVYDFRAEVPVPARDLQPGERFAQIGLTGAWGIVKDSAQPSAGGSIDIGPLLARLDEMQGEQAAQRAMLTQILEGLALLSERIR